MHKRKMIKKFLIVGIIIFLTACQPRLYTNSTYQNESSELIPLLLTKDDLSKISNQFVWLSILSKQEQNVLDTNSSTQFELSSRKYRGYYQTSDRYVTIWHTITRYDTPINLEELTSLMLGGVSDKDVASTYFPDIKTLGNIVSKCATVRQSGQICEVDIKYNYIESNIYILTTDISGEEVIQNWLNAIISAVEPRIALQDFAK